MIHLLTSDAILPLKPTAAVDALDPQLLIERSTEPIHSGASSPTVDRPGTLQVQTKN
jgi:hypothetical protein